MHRRDEVRMIVPLEKLSLTRQCQLLKIPRSTYYSVCQGENAYNLRLMRMIDEKFLEEPYFGSRQMMRWLRMQGYNVGRKRVRCLMKLLGLEALYQKPNTSKPHPGHKIYPYLLRNLVIDRPNQVWCADITYIPVKRGFLYLVAIMDWYSRKVLSWRLSNSMDGKGRWMDNVFIERLWRSLKYECVYLYGFEGGKDARQKIDHWMEKYNRHRPHSALDGVPPNWVYYRSSGLTQKNGMAA